jgi:hypothetical protein
MSRGQQARVSFSAGVLSPRLAVRSDLEKYQSGLRQAINWIISPQGGMIMRPGQKNIAPISFPSAPNRIFQFHKGGNESDMIVEVTAGDGLVHFWVDGVKLPDTVSHDYTQAQLENLYFTNQEVTAWILHPDHPPLYIDIALDGSISGEYLPSNLVPPADYEDAHSPAASVQIAVTYTTDWINGDATTWNPSRGWVLRYDGVYASKSGGSPKVYEFNSTTATLAARVDKALNLIPSLKGDDTEIIVTVGAPGTDWNLVDITITGPGGGKTLEILPANPLADRYVSVETQVDEEEVLEPAWSYPAYVFHNGKYYQCIAPHTPEAVNEPGVGAQWTTYWTDLGATKPATFDWQYPDGNDWEIYFVGTPPDYADATGVPAYSPQDRGFPTVGVVHQQRLILMANPGFTMGIFGSRINQYRDFVTGPQDDDPFFFAIDTSDTPTIKWAESQQNLIIGTSSGDYNLTAQVTLSPSDIQALKQNNARSNQSKPVTINTDIFYIEQGKEKVRSTSYIRDVQAQSSADVSLLAEHLLDARAKRLVLMQTPEVMIYILREDGSLACISYSHELKQGAWFEFATQGTITDLAVAYTTTTDEDELWMTVTYDDTTYELEKMPYPARVFTWVEEEGDTPMVEQGIVCMDTWVSGTLLDGENNIITGLDRLNGMEVGAMVDDAWTGLYTVNDGAIILDVTQQGQNYEGTYAVGLMYTATSQTFEMISGNRKGTALGTKRRWNRLFVKTLDSALPVINGVLPPDRSPQTPMGIPEIIQEGLQDHEVRQVGWGDGAITVVQDRPYPTHVLGMFGEFSSNNA